MRPADTPCPAARFLFHPTNIRTPTVTFRYVRSASPGAYKGDGRVLASARVAFRSADEPLGLHLSLTAQPAAMRITWTSNSSTAAAVQFGAAPGALTRRAAAVTTTFGADDLCSVRRGRWAERGYIHSATMPGLAPGSATYYRVGHPSLATSWSSVRRFRTQPPHGAPTTVLLLGDLGVPVNDSSYDTEAQDKGVLNDYPLQTMATIGALGEAERSASALLVGDLSCKRSAGKLAACGFVSALSLLGLLPARRRPVL